MFGVWSSVLVFAVGLSLGQAAPPPQQHTSNTTTINTTTITATTPAAAAATPQDCHESMQHHSNATSSNTTATTTPAATPQQHPSNTTSSNTTTTATPAAAAAATPQDCHESMLASLSLDNATQFSGRWNFIEGFSDHNDFIHLLNWTQSSWIDFTPSAQDNRTLTMVAHERMKGGVCTVDLFNVTITSNVTMDVRGNIIESKFNLLSTCDDCLVVNITTTKRCDKSDNPPVHHSLYILARGRGLTHSDLLGFHQQARCMNFTLPPDFHYDHKQEFCPEHNMEAAVEKPESNVVPSRWDTKTVCS